MGRWVQMTDLDRLVPVSTIECRNVVLVDHEHQKCFDSSSGFIRQCTSSRRWWLLIPGNSYVVPIERHSTIYRGRLVRSN